MDGSLLSKPRSREEERKRRRKEVERGRDRGGGYSGIGKVFAALLSRTTEEQGYSSRLAGGLDLCQKMALGGMEADAGLTGADGHRRRLHFIVLVACNRPAGQGEWGVAARPAIEFGVGV